MKNKSQVLLTVIFLLLLAGVLMAGLASMWRAETRMYLLNRDGLGAFYLAQAGIERAKIELRNNWNWTGISSEALGEGTYTVVISSAGLNLRTVVSSGRVRDCLRQIRVNIRRRRVGPTYIYQQVRWTWREI